MVSRTLTAQLWLLNAANKRTQEEKIKTERAISGIISCNWGQLATNRFVVFHPDPGNTFPWPLTVAPVGYANPIWVTNISSGRRGVAVGMASVHIVAVRQVT